PPSGRDYIARYTHPISTGTFNRCYATRVRNNVASFHYTAPDAPGGAAFQKIIVLRGSRSIDVSTSGHVRGNERPQQLTSFRLASSTTIVHAANGFALYEPKSKRAFLVAWNSRGVQATLERHAADVLLTLTYAGGRRVLTRFDVEPADTPADAQAALTAFANRP
ncbi:MAG TPA: hypothetical protein VFE17_13055, partial [Candidatus Baltobacteraceae bacterium]|nr:hypothetical protein [Candidatus Baltobacteraceae bacterium]